MGSPRRPPPAASSSGTGRSTPPASLAAWPPDCQQANSTLQGMVLSRQPAGHMHSHSPLQPSLPLPASRCQLAAAGQRFRRQPPAGSPPDPGRGGPHACSPEQSLWGPSGAAAHHAPLPQHSCSCERRPEGDWRGWDEPDGVPGRPAAHAAPAALLPVSRLSLECIDAPAVSRRGRPTCWEDGVRTPAGLLAAPAAALWSAGGPSEALPCQLQ